MEHYTQNHAHILQRYIVIVLECLLLYYGFKLGAIISIGHWDATFSTGEGFLLLYVFIASWIAFGAIFNYFSHAAIYQPIHLLRASWINIALVGLVSFMLQNTFPSFFPQFWFNGLTGIISAVAGRFLLSFLYRHRRIFFSLTGEEYKVMIVGAGDTATQLDLFFQQVKGSKVFHYLNTKEQEQDEDKAVETLRQDQQKFQQLCLEREVSEIYYTLPLEATDVIEEIADFADNHYITFKVANDFHLHDKHRDYSVAFFNHTPIISLRKDPLAQIFNRVIKRIFDIIFSGLVILLVMPWLFTLIAIAIRLDSKGPILFLQKRSGRKNKKFTCFKFRTMYVQKEEDKTPYKQASKNDPRITNVGAFLRKSSLDEFPQFFNVLLGQMSVVGPRPHPTKLNNIYMPLIKKYPFRYFITPGITGHAQVNGYRGETKDPEEMKKRVEYDSWYIQNWSMGLDIKIIWQTIFSISAGDDNAY